MYARSCEPSLSMRATPRNLRYPGVLELKRGQGIITSRHESYLTMLTNILSQSRTLNLNTIQSSCNDTYCVAWAIQLSTTNPTINTNTLSSENFMVASSWLLARRSLSRQT